jgi:MoxR-like ATPase
MYGRDFTLPDDVKAVASVVLAHRLTLSVESELEGVNAKNVIENIIQKIEAPKGIKSSAE